MNKQYGVTYREAFGRVCARLVILIDEIADALAQPFEWSLTCETRERHLLLLGRDRREAAYKAWNLPDDLYQEDINKGLVDSPYPKEFAELMLDYDEIYNGKQERRW